MESVNRQTLEPMLGGAFDDGAYGVTSADLDPLNVDHVGYSLSPVTSYVPAGLQSWNPYLGSVSLPGTTTEQNFDPSYTLDVSATPEHAAGPSAAEFQPVLEWSVDLQNYQHQTRTDVDYGHGFQATVGPIYTDFRPEYVVQQPDSNDTQPYSHQQLSSVQQYNYQDAVSSVAPTPVSHHSPSKLQQCELPGGMTKEQLAEQDNALHQQSAAHLQKLYRAGSISGTKRTKTDDRSAPQLPQHVSKRRSRRRKSQPAPHEPVTARVDVWTRPTPVAFNTYHSSSSQGESASSSSPTLYKKASLLSIADGSNSSRLESYDGHRPQGRFETNSGDNSDRMEYVLSPVQTISGSLGLSPSPGVTTSSTAFSTPATSIHPASSASSAVSNLQSNQLQPTSTTSTKQPQTTARSFPSTSRAEPPNSKPAPGPAGRTNAPHSDLDPKGKARRYSSAVSHGPDPDHDPDPPPKPRRVSGSAADQKARNRVAATKCRLKTKAAISRLEVEERAASEQNAALATAVAQLRQESYLLRSQLLLHAGCDCRLIQQYLASQAKKLAEAGRGEGTARSAEGGSENEMVTGSRDVGQRGQRGQRRWNDHDRGAVVFESDDNYDDNDDDDDGDDENWES